jgi:phospho-N-acetylmuramoyl-pentapeptide-transferase
MITALIIAYMVFPLFIEWMKQRRVDQIIRTDGPESHLREQGGHAHDGRVCILLGGHVSTLLWARLDVAGVDDCSSCSSATASSASSTTGRR